MKKTRGRKVALASAIALLLLLPVVLWTSWADILFLIAFERLGQNEQGYAEHRHRQTGIVFVSLPGGTFMMGSREDWEVQDPAETLHEVTLSPFLIAKYEVTQKQWMGVMGPPPEGFAIPGDNYQIPSILLLRSLFLLFSRENVVDLGLPIQYNPRLFQGRLRR